jgi:hypothetical protein
VAVGWIVSTDDDVTDSYILLPRRLLDAEVVDGRKLLSLAVADGREVNELVKEGRALPSRAAGRKLLR